MGDYQRTVESLYKKKLDQGISYHLGYASILGVKTQTGDKLTTSGRPRQLLLKLRYVDLRDLSTVTDFYSALVLASGRDC